MGKREKLIEKIKTKPKDFTWDEATALMRYFGYRPLKGKGSRRKFFNKETGGKIFIHEPHPGNILKEYQINDILCHLQERGLLK